LNSRCPPTCRIPFKYYWPPISALAPALAGTILTLIHFYIPPLASERFNSYLLHAMVPDPKARSNPQTTNVTESPATPHSRKAESSKEGVAIAQDPITPLPRVELNKDGTVPFPSSDVQKKLFEIPFKLNRKERISVDGDYIIPFTGLANLNILYYQHSLTNMHCAITENKGVINENQLTKLRETLREYCMNLTLTFRIMA
jgi:hypothetical protein